MPQRNKEGNVKITINEEGEEVSKKETIIGKERE